MAAASYEDLKKLPVWSQFQPKVDGGPKLSEAQLRKRFDVLHKALDGDKNLQGFAQAVAAALAPCEQHGLLEKLDQPLGQGKEKLDQPLGQGKEKLDQPLGQGNQEEIAVHLPGQPEPQIIRVSEAQIGNGSAIQESLHGHLKPPELADLVFDWLQPRLKAAATLKLDEAQTQRALEQAAAAVKDVVKEYKKGEILAPVNDSLTDDQLRLLKKENEAVMAKRTLLQRVLRAAALVVFILGMFALCGLYLHNRERRLVVSLRRLATMLAMALFTVALSCWASADAWRAEIIPLLLFGQIAAIAYSRELALLFSGVVAMIIALALGHSLWPLFVLLVVTATAVLQLRRIRSRSKLIYVGLYAGLVAMLLSFCVAVLDKQPTRPELLIPIGEEASRTALWTVAAGFLMTGLLPFVESFFGVLTDISLLELGDVSHPLLQELVRRAPSTYNHSITVGSIAEAAADTIGAGTAGPRGRLFPRHRQDAQAGVLRREPVGGRQPPRVADPGHEPPGDRRSHQGRRRPRPAAQASRADHRFHRAAPRHDAGRLLLPPGQRAEPGRSQRRRGRGEQFPLSRAAPSDQGGRRADAHRLGRERLPVAARPGPLADRVPGPRNRRAEARRRPVRREQPHAPRAADHRAEHRQVADRQLPRPRKVSRPENRLMITIDVANEQSTLPVDDGRLRRAVRMILQGAAVRRARVSLAVVDDATIHRLNRRYLDQDCATDVLSFNLDDSGGSLEGEVIVSADTAAAVAPRFGWRPEDELLLYVIHGALHLVGLRDGTDDQRDQMRRRQRECLARFGLEPHDEELAALECGDLSPLFQGRCRRPLPVARNKASKAATSRRTPKCGRAGPEEVT